MISRSVLFKNIVKIKFTKSNIFPSILIKKTLDEKEYKKYLEQIIFGLDEKEKLFCKWAAFLNIKLYLYTWLYYI